MFKTSPRKEISSGFNQDEDELDSAFGARFDTIKQRGSNVTNSRSRSFQAASPIASPVLTTRHGSDYGLGLRTGIGSEFGTGSGHGSSHGLGHGSRHGSGSGHRSGNERHGKEQRTSRSGSSTNVQPSSSSRHINVVKAQLTLDISPITSSLPSNGRRKKKSSKPSLATSLSKLNIVNNEVKEKAYAITKQKSTTKKYTYREYAEAQLAQDKAQQKEHKKLEKRSLSHDSRLQNKSPDDETPEKHKKKTSCHSNFLYSTAQESFDPPENLRISSGPKPGTVSINVDTQTSPSSVDLLDLESGIRVSTCELDPLQILQQRFLEGRHGDAVGFGELGLVGRSNKKNKGPRLVRQTAATIDCVHVDRMLDDCTICVEDHPVSDSQTIAERERKSSGSIRDMGTPEIKISFTPGGECVHARGKTVGDEILEHGVSSDSNNIQCKCIECYVRNNQNSFIIDEGGRYRRLSGDDKNTNLKGKRAESFDSRNQLTGSERVTLTSYKSRSFDCHTHTTCFHRPGNALNNDKHKQISYSNELKPKSKSFDMPEQSHTTYLVENDIERTFKSDHSLHSTKSPNQKDKQALYREDSYNQYRDSNKENVEYSPVRTRYVLGTKQTNGKDNRRHSTESRNVNYSVQRQRNHSACDEWLLNPRKFHDDGKRTTGGNNANLLHPSMISNQQPGTGVRRNRSRSMEDTVKINNGLSVLSKSFDERLYKNNRNVNNHKNTKTHQQRQREGKMYESSSSDDEFTALGDLDKEMNSQSDKAVKRQEIRKRRQCYTNSKQSREYGSSQEIITINNQTSTTGLCQTETGRSDVFPRLMGSSFDERLLPTSIQNDSNGGHLKYSKGNIDDLKRKSRSFDVSNSLHPNSAFDDKCRNQGVIVSKELNTSKDNDRHNSTGNKETLPPHGPIHSKSFQERSETLVGPFNYEDLNGNHCVYQSRSCEGRINTKKQHSLQSNDSLSESQQPYTDIDQTQECPKDKLFMKKYIPYMTRISHDSSVETSVDSNEYEYDLKSGYGKTRSFDERMSRNEQIHTHQHQQQRSHSFSLHQTNSGFHDHAPNASSVDDPYKTYSRRSFDTGYLYPGRSDSSVNNNSNEARKKHSNNRVLTLSRGDANAPRKRHSYSNGDEYSITRRRGREHSIPSRASTSPQGDNSRSGDALLYTDNANNGRRARSFDIYDAKSKANLDGDSLGMTGRFCVNSDGCISTRKHRLEDSPLSSRSGSMDNERTNRSILNNESLDRRSDHSPRSPTSRQRFPRRQEAQDDGTFHQAHPERDISDVHKNSQWNTTNSEGDISANQEPKHCGILTCRCYQRQSPPQKVFPNTEVIGSCIKDKQLFSNNARRSYSDDTRQYSVDACGDLRTSDQSSKSCEHVVGNKQTQPQLHSVKVQSACHIIGRGRSDSTGKAANSANYKIGKNNQLTVCFNKMTKKSKSLDTTNFIDRHSTVGALRTKSPPAVRSLDRDILLCPSVDKASSPDGSSGSSSMNSQRSRNQKRLDVENVPSPIIIISPCADEMFGHNIHECRKNDYSQDCTIASSVVPEVKQQTQIDHLPGETVTGDNYVVASMDTRRAGGITCHDEKIRFTERNDITNRQATNASKGDNRDNGTKKRQEKLVDERTPLKPKFAQSCLTHASPSFCVAASCPRGDNKGQRGETKGENNNIGKWMDKGIRMIGSRDGVLDTNQSEIRLANLQKGRGSKDEKVKVNSGTEDKKYSICSGVVRDYANDNGDDDDDDDDDDEIHNAVSDRNEKHKGLKLKITAASIEDNKPLSIKDQKKENYGNNPCMKYEDNTSSLGKNTPNLDLSDSRKSTVHEKRKNWLNIGERRGAKERGSQSAELESEEASCQHGNDARTCPWCYFSRSMDQDFRQKSKRDQISRALSCNYDERKTEEGECNESSDDFNPDIHSREGVVSDGNQSENVSVREKKRTNGNENKMVRKGKNEYYDDEDMRVNNAKDKENSGICALSPTHPAQRCSPPSTPLSSKHRPANSAHFESACGGSQVEARIGESAPTTTNKTRKRPVTYCCRIGATDKTYSNSTTSFVTTTTATTTATAAASSIAISSAATPEAFYSSPISFSTSLSSSRHHPHHTQSLPSNTLYYSRECGETGEEDVKRNSKDFTCTVSPDSRSGAAKTSGYQNNTYKYISSQQGIPKNFTHHHSKDPSFLTSFSRKDRGNENVIRREIQHQKESSSSPSIHQTGIQQHRTTSTSSSSLQLSSSFQLHHSHENNNGQTQNSSDALNSTAKFDNCDKKSGFRFLFRPKLLGDTFRQSSLPSRGFVRDATNDNSLLQHSSTDPELSPVSRDYSNDGGDRKVIGLEYNCMHTPNRPIRCGVQDIFPKDTTCNNSVSDHSGSSVLCDNRNVRSNNHNGFRNKNKDAPVISVSGYNNKSNSKVRKQIGGHVALDDSPKNSKSLSNINKTVNSQRQNSEGGFSTGARSKVYHSESPHHNVSDSERCLFNENEDVCLLHNNHKINDKENQTDNEKYSERNQYPRQEGYRNEVCVEEGHGERAINNDRIYGENSHSNNNSTPTCNNDNYHSSNVSSYLQPSSSSSSRHCLGHRSCLRSRSADIGLCNENVKSNCDKVNTTSESLRVRAPPPHQSHSFDEIIHLNKIKNQANNAYCDSWINDNNNDFGLTHDNNGDDGIIILNSEDRGDNNSFCYHHHHHHHNHHHSQHCHINNNRLQQHNEPPQLNTRSSSFDLEHAQRCGKCTQIVKADIHNGGSPLLSYCSNGNSSSNNNVQTSNEIGSFSSRDTVIYQPANENLVDDDKVHHSSSALDISFALASEKKRTREDQKDTEGEEYDNKSDSEDLDVEATPLLIKPMAGACQDGRGIEIIVSDENDATVSTVQTGKGAIFRRIWLVLLDNRMAGRPDAESAIQPQPDEYRLLKKTLNIVFIVVGIALLISVFVVIAYTYAVDPDDQRDITGRRSQHTKHPVHTVEVLTPIILNNITDTTSTP